VVELGGDVKEAVLRSEERHVRTYAVPEVEAADNFLRGDIDDHEVAAVSAGLAHAGIAINGDVSETPVGRGDHLMTCSPAFGN